MRPIILALSVLTLPLVACPPHADAPAPVEPTANAQPNVVQPADAQCTIVNTTAGSVTVTGAVPDDVTELAAGASATLSGHRTAKTADGKSAYVYCTGGVTLKLAEHEGGVAFLNADGTVHVDTEGVEE